MKGNKGKNILIVDDNMQNIQLAAEVLKSGGYNIFFALNGKSALENLQKNKIDLILLDIMMPEMDGIETCRIIHANPDHCGIPVIFCTAKYDSSTIKSAFEAGGVDYVTKPFLAEELKARIETHLSLKEREEELKQINAQKDKFYSLIVHDMRNIMTLIVNSADILLNFNMKKNETLAQNKNLLEDLFTSSKNLNNLLNNFLKWAALRLNKVQVHKEKFQIKNIIDEILVIYKTAAANKSIEIAVDIDSRHYAYSEKYFIITAIRNILSNAIKYTENFGSIYISSKITNDEIIISIADNGIGMTEEKIEELLKGNMLQKSTKGTSNEKGSGMGLFLASELLKRIDGRIECDSRPAKGSVFRIIIPEEIPLLVTDFEL